MMIERRQLLLLMALLISLWDRGSSQQNPCAGQLSCAACIGEAGCGWCFQTDFPTSMRCQPAVNHTVCPRNNVANPQSQFASRVVTGDGPIDVSRVRVNLRVGDSQPFRVSVTPQRNLPLDLYILIDLSNSMLAELATLQNISTRIASTIGSVTNNVRLGFGAFNEKEILPFQEQPLDPSQPLPNLVNSFAFRHIVSLTNDTNAFSSEIARLVTTSNVDRPENGFDGLAQVITCEEIIGWRDRTSGVGSRLVLFMTDEQYHYAGEGRLAGILRPYNGECLLEPNPNGPVEYTRALEFDYPSVGQILQLLQDFDVTTIFAIQEDNQAPYQTLADTVLNVNSIRAVTQGFTIQQADSAAGTAILQLIEEEYRRLLQGVSLDTSAVNTAIDVTVSASCPPTASQDGERACAEVPLDEAANFTISATLNSCEGLTDGQVIESVITSPSFGSFVLEVTAICDCQCADAPPVEGDCNGNGVRRCAECVCNNLTCGSSCNQLIGDRTSLDCPRGGNGQRCSARGRCDCVCFCDEADQPDQSIFGPACECDNFRCTRTSEDPIEVCSGLDRGMCCDGRCLCRNSSSENPYRGDGIVNNCQCEPLEEVCIDPVNGILCNGRGTCGCQFCECTDMNYRGTFCDLENNDNCGFEDDSQCLMQCRGAFPEASLPDVCPEDCTRTRPLLFVNVEDIVAAGADSFQQSVFLEETANALLSQEANTPGAFTFRRRCTYEDRDGCFIDYNVLINATHIVIVAERVRTCLGTGATLLIPEYAVALVVLGGLLLLGVLLLILIKIIFLILDYIEVKKWQKDAQTADFSKNTNPLYQSPEMKYENIAYGRE